MRDASTDDRCAMIPLRNTRQYLVAFGSLNEEMEIVFIAFA